MHKLVIFTLVNNFKLFSGNMDEKSFFFLTRTGALTTKMTSKISYHI
jgi:hypothetical protein